MDDAAVGAAGSVGIAEGPGAEGVTGGAVEGAACEEEDSAEVAAAEVD